MRSTALHNTLALDGRSQSMPSGPFHWAHVANGTRAPLAHRRGVRLLRRLARRLSRRSSTGAACSRCTATCRRRRPRRRRRRARRRGALARRSALDVSRRARRGAVFTVRRTGDRVGLSVPAGHRRALQRRRRHRARLVLAGLRPRRARDDRSRQLTTRHGAVLDGQRLRPRSAQRGRRRRLVPVVGGAGALATPWRSGSRATRRSTTCCSRSRRRARRRMIGALGAVDTWRVGDV